MEPGPRRADLVPMLQAKVLANGKRRAYWAYPEEEEEAKDEDKDDNDSSDDDKPRKADPYPRNPALPWPWSRPDGEGNVPAKYAKFPVSSTFFHNAHEYRSLLVNAAKAERAVQREAVQKIFDPQRLHRAVLEPIPENPGSYLVHIKLVVDLAKDGMPPKLNPSTQVDVCPV